MIRNANSPVPRRIVDGRRLAACIRAACIRKGWDLSELARRAGISRTTLYHLERGITRRPHAATLSRLAAVLEIPAERLSMPAPVPERAAAGDGQREEPRGRSFEDGRAAAGRFDRDTNPVVAEVAAESPGLFRGWGPDEWDELYSTFGTGGALTREGVHATAARMNRNRDLVQKVQVVLETHLSEVAAGMIEALYEQVRVRPAGPSEDDDRDVRSGGVAEGAPEASWIGGDERGKLR